MWGKIVTAMINNNLKLIDSYAFVAHALAKFPSIFNIPEEKKDSFLIHSTYLNFVVTLVRLDEHHNLSNGFYDPTEMQCWKSQNLFQ